ncbi:peptidylprolyl isomerase [Flavobacterium terrisoli]|uniref:peptidylprolyl isomerase n=1 Tax=Flavobacterium terrisoli TaxID=3242195 RepID=UPI00254294C3|nr:peptidylprolyl isomerase [Flavobacterium buctense]
MKKTISLFVLALSIMVSSCKEEHKNLKDGLYAEIETTKGIILLRLDYKKAPVTVANFVTLAEGNNPFVMDDLKGKPFYDGTIFHRVEPGFVIQGGDPYGNGSGDPGYIFKNEISTLKHDKAGILAMANSGPDTNGCQFYITLKATPQLDGGYSIFGRVAEGMDVVNKIEKNDEMIAVTIIRKGEDVKKFDAVQVFSDYFKKQKSAKDQKTNAFNDIKKAAIKLPSGVAYKITQTSTSESPKQGSKLTVIYSGFLEDGTLVDTSEPEVAKQHGIFDERRAMQNGYSRLTYNVGGANQLIPGMIEGIQQLKAGEKAILFIPSDLAYGEQGAGRVIPPNANMVFEIEILK